MNIILLRTFPLALFNHLSRQTMQLVLCLVIFENTFSVAMSALLLIASLRDLFLCSFDPLCDLRSCEGLTVADSFSIFQTATGSFLKLKKYI